MAFTLSGSYIQVTGTETSLAGLAAVSGVTSLEVGTGELSRNIYNIGTKGLRIMNGATLTINPYVEEFISSAVSDYGLTIDSGGTVLVEGYMTMNGVTKYTQRRWYTHQFVSDYLDLSIHVNNGGTLDWRGGEAMLAKAATFESTAVVTIVEGVIDNYIFDKDGVRTELPSSQQIRTYTPNLNISGIILKRGMIVIMAPFGSITGMRAEHCNKPFGMSSSSANVDLHLEEYTSGGGNVRDFGLWGGSKPVYTNAANGSDLLVGGDRVSNATSYGFAVVRQGFNPVIKDVSNNPIEGAVIFVHDNDNGLRSTYTSENYLNTAGLQVDPDQTFIYKETTGSSGNLATEMYVYTAFMVINQGDTVLVDVGTWDRRCRSNNITDDFDVSVVSLNHLMSSYTVIMKGLTNVTSGTKLLVDPLFSIGTGDNIADAITINAYPITVTLVGNTLTYTGDSNTLQTMTANQAYDIAKAYLVKFYTGQDNTLVTRIGTTIDARALDIVLDYITFIGSLETTGTITYNNGSTISDIASDSSGTTGKLTLTSLVSMNVYVEDGSGTQVDYQADVTGTYNLSIPAGSTGTWKWVVKNAGYVHAIGNISVTNGGLFTAEPVCPQKLNPDGSAMYTSSSSSLIDVDFTGLTQANIKVGNGIASLQATFNETERSLETADGLAWLASGNSDCSQFNSAGGDYLFMSTGWRLVRRTPTDVNATLNAFAQGSDGVIVDGTNGSVQFLTSDSPTSIASAVRAELSIELARIDAAISSRSEFDHTSDPVIIPPQPPIDLSSLETKVQADARQALLIAEHTETQADLASVLTQVNDSKNTIISAIGTIPSGVWSYVKRTLNKSLFE